MSQQDESHALSETQNMLEGSMKELLEKILTYMEKFIKTKEDLQAIESKLNDYDNLLSLMDIIKNIFQHLTEKVDQALKSKGSQNREDNSTAGLESGDRNYESGANDEEYQQLEKIVQKHEAEIRTHIRLEQQLKLYAESLQAKLEESEKTRSDLLDSTKHLINGVKRDNQKLSESVRQLKDENERLQQRLKQFEEKEKTYEEKVQNMPYLQEKIFTLEKLIQERQSSHSMHSLQKENSYRKITPNDLDSGKAKKIKSETPPVGLPGTSPLKGERRAPTPNVLSSSKNTVTREDKDFKTSYKNFYNQVKKTRGDSQLSMQGFDVQQNTSHKDLRSIYANSSVPRNSSKEKDIKTLSSATGSIMGSVALQQSQSQQAGAASQSTVIPQHPPHPSSAQGGTTHKRSKSHQVNKIRGLVGGSKHVTDYSRLSNQEFAEALMAGSQHIPPDNIQSQQQQQQMSQHSKHK